MNRLKKLLFAALCVMLLITSQGCAKKQNEDASIPTQLPSIVTAKPQEGYANYLSAYMNMLTDFVSVYGRFPWSKSNETTANPKGLFYGKLMDLDTDGTPELICGVGIDEERTGEDGNLYTVAVPYFQIYTFSGGEAVQKLSVEVSTDEWDADDALPTITYYDNDSAIYVRLITPSETEDKVTESFFTISKGELETQTFVRATDADAETLFAYLNQGIGDDPFTYYVGDETVQSDEYETERSKYVSNSMEVNMFANYTNTNYDELIMFIESFNEGIS